MLPAVRPTDITLVVAAGSVSVDAFIHSADADATLAAVQPLTASAGTATSLLGVPVESLSAPMITTTAELAAISPSPPHPPSMPLSADDTLPSTAAGQTTGGGGGTLDSPLFVVLAIAGGLATAASAAVAARQLTKLSCKRRAQVEVKGKGSTMEHSGKEMVSQRDFVPETPASAVVSL